MKLQKRMKLTNAQTCPSVQISPWTYFTPHRKAKRFRFVPDYNTLALELRLNAEHHLHTLYEYSLRQVRS